MDPLLGGGLAMVAAPLLLAFSGVYGLRRERPRAAWRRYFELYAHVHLLVLAPILFLRFFDGGTRIDCCGDQVVFAPAHRPTLFATLALVWAAYFYSRLRTRLGPPLLELLASVVLVLGFVLNVAIFFHIANVGDISDPRGSSNLEVAVLGNAPIAWLLLARLTLNHRLYVSEFEGRNYRGASERVRKFLTSSAFTQVPWLVLLTAPVVVILSAILIVVGQAPDAWLHLFRDTYQHGLSGLTPECLEVNCGERHYLCTIAARGHGRLVQPLRVGYRRGRVIVCNRQLLVANAFEELLAERFPRAHRIVRQNYDRLGRLLARGERALDSPWLSDAVYLAMKPAEYFFLAVLYLHDRQPERRIARQYAAGAVSAPPRGGRTAQPGGRLG